MISTYEGVLFYVELTNESLTFYATKLGVLYETLPLSCASLTLFAFVKVMEQDLV